MALTPIPPWLDVGPSTYLGAARAGATAGQEAANALNQFNLAQQQMASHAATAAAQISAERENAAAAHALALEKERGQHELEQAHLALATNRLSDLNDYRARENSLRERSILDRENQLLGRTNQPIHVGNSLVKIGPDGKPVVLFNADSNQVSPLDRLRYAQALREKNNAATALMKPDLSPEDSTFWKSKGESADKILQDIEGRYVPSSVNNAGAAATPLGDQNFGDLFDSTILGGAMDFGFPNSEGGPLIDTGTPSDAGAVRVLKITPKQ